MQVELSKEVVRILEQIAQRRSMSVRELVEQAIQQLIDRETETHQQRVERALSVVGKYRLGVSDLAENHDFYFAESVSESSL